MHTWHSSLRTDWFLALHVVVPPGWGWAEGLGLGLVLELGLGLGLELELYHRCAHRAQV